MELWDRNELLKYQMCLISKASCNVPGSSAAVCSAGLGSKGKATGYSSIHTPCLHSKPQNPHFQSGLPSQDQKGLPHGWEIWRGGSQHPPPLPLVPSPCGHILQLLQFLQLLQHGLGQQPALLWGRGESGGHGHSRLTPGPAGARRGSAVPSAPRTAPGAAAASPSAAPGACGEAGASVSIPWGNRGDQGRG